MSGIELIAAERQRQIGEEGWTPEHDALHGTEELAVAAALYALPDRDRPMRMRDPAGVPRTWPWGDSWWKPCPDDRVRELVKAGALIAAEIDRLQRADDHQGDDHG